MSTEGASLVPPSPKAVTMSMENTPSPLFSITSSIFGFLKSLDWQSVGLNSNMIPLVHPITGWEIVVYDSVVTESRLGGLEADSIGQPKEFDVVHVGNEFIVENAEDSDEDEPILRFKRTVPTKPKITTKPTLKRQRRLPLHPTYFSLHPITTSNLKFRSSHCTALTRRQS